RPQQFLSLTQLEATEQLGQLPALSLAAAPFGAADGFGEAAHALDELEEPVAFQLPQNVTEGGAEEVDVGAQLVEGRLALEGGGGLGVRPHRLLPPRPSPRPRARAPRCGRYRWPGYR